jgi:hypothetical protein
MTVSTNESDQTKINRAIHAITPVLASSSRHHRILLLARGNDPERAVR